MISKNGHPGPLFEISESEKSLVEISAPDL